MEQAQRNDGLSDDGAAVVSAEVADTEVVSAEVADTEVATEEVEAPAWVLEPAPSVGQIVHVSQQGLKKPIAAIVVDVWPCRLGEMPAISAHGFLNKPGQTCWFGSIPHESRIEEGRPHWSWPPRV